MKFLISKFKEIAQNLMNVQVLAKFPLLQALDSTQYKLLLLLLHQTTPVGRKLCMKGYRLR